MDVSRAFCIAFVSLDTLLTWLLSCDAYTFRSHRMS
jgi:hypothetical protein